MIVRTSSGRTATGFKGAVTNSENGDDYNVRCGPSTYGTLLGCNVLGGIYHSEPFIQPPPPGYISDDAYRSFAAFYKNRPSALYVETLDGLLHAFDATNDTASVVDRTSTSSSRSFLLASFTR